MQYLSPPLPSPLFPLPRLTPPPPPPSPFPFRSQTTFFFLTWHEHRVWQAALLILQESVVSTWHDQVIPSRFLEIVQEAKSTIALLSAGHHQQHPEKQAAVYRDDRRTGNCAGAPQLPEGTRHSASKVSRLVFLRPWPNGTPKSSRLVPSSQPGPSWVSFDLSSSLVQVGT